MSAGFQPFDRFEQYRINKRGNGGKCALQCIIRTNDVSFELCNPFQQLLLRILKGHGTHTRNSFFPKFAYAVTLRLKSLVLRLDINKVDTLPLIIKMRHLAFI